MRSGRLLVEDSPENLLREFQLSSLEDVFIQFSLKDDGRRLIHQVSETESNTSICYSTGVAPGTRQPSGSYVNTVTDNPLETSKTANSRQIDNVKDDCPNTTAREYNN